MRSAEITDSTAHYHAGVTVRSTLGLQLHAPRRSQVEFAAKAGIGAAIALWAATAIGLKDPYWASISAVVATAGTLGASVGASINRIAATLVALVVAVAVVAVLPVGGMLVAGALVTIVLLIMFALSLDAGARLAAASTLIVTTASGGDPVGVALSRGLNVPLGCTIAVALGFVLLPRRAARQLNDALTADEAAAATLAGQLVATYVARQAPSPELSASLAGLAKRVAGHRSTLADAAREPGSGQDAVRRLGETLDAVESLLSIDVTLARVATAATNDEAVTLVTDELASIATVLEAAAPLAPALDALDAGFAAVRERRGTVTFGTDELARLLTVVRLVHNVGAVRDRQPLA